MPPSNQDTRWMQVALAAARRAEGRTGENPPVGCALVSADGHLISVGCTAPGGRPHAETAALAAADPALVRCGTAYVTLEPCAHTGVTGPCAEALISAQVARVVVAVGDPDPRVNGRGLAMLRAAGIKTEIGVCAAVARGVLAGFFQRISMGRPHITVKTATSLDGMIALADGKKRWLTGPAMRAYVHQMRSRTNALLTGVGTVLADDPAFTCRIPGLAADSPRRYVMDSHLRTPITAALLQDDVPVSILCSQVADATHAEALGAKGATIRRLEAGPDGRVSLEAALAQMAADGVNNLMVEAGAGLVTSLGAAGLIDRLVWTQSHHIIGQDGIPAFGALNAVELRDDMHYMHEQMIGPDRLIVLERSTQS